MSKRRKQNRSESQITAPTSEQLEGELKRVRFKNKYARMLISTVSILVVVAAVSVLVATLVLPVLEIYGTSMTPTLTEGDIVVSLKKDSFEQGDIICFYYSNRILVKRVIGKPLDMIELDEEGNFTVNGVPLEEPYITEKAFGECDIEFPYQVPESMYFVVGDHRSTSIDSRNSSVGCIATDEIVGKILFTVWPFRHFGKVK